MKSDSNITIKEVLDGDELKKFVMFPHTLYKNSKYQIRKKKLAHQKMSFLPSRT